MTNAIRRVCVILSVVVLAACAAPLTGGIRTMSTLKYLPPSTPEIPLPAGPTQKEFDYPVMFGTTRKETPDGSGFTSERDQALHYGQAIVKIPKNHHVGSLGTDLGTFLGTDPKLTVISLEKSLDEEHFLAQVKSALSPITGPESAYVVVFIHGYNNSFEDATLRAAQLGVDLGVPPYSMFLFSWAARNHILEYTFDEATIDSSEIYLRAFLEGIGRATAGRTIHIVAHSMGNRALLRVIASSVTNAALEYKLQFGQIILAAADVDVELFTQLAPAYVKVADRTTIYLSPYDFAVGLSEKVHEYPRVGCGTTPHVVIPGIDSVVSTVPEDPPGHAYFAESLPILADIKNLILRNQPARSGKDWQNLGDHWIVGGPPHGLKVVCH